MSIINPVIRKSENSAAVRGISTTGDLLLFNTRI